MKIFKCLLGIVLSAGLLSGGDSQAQAQSFKLESGVPSKRVGAGTRDHDRRTDGPLSIIAKRGITEVASLTPALHWHLAEDVSGTVTLTLKAAGAATPH